VTSRSHVFITAGALVVASIAHAASSPEAVVTDAIFSHDSFWYTAIPANAPLNPNSTAYVAEFLRQKRAYYGTVNINTAAYASPVYVVPKDAATTRVTHDCGKAQQTIADPSLDKQWSAVPIPADATQAQGTDSEMTVFQPSTDSLWEFWLMRRGPTGWSACWGGMMNPVSKNPGIWPNHYGTTATSLPFVGGQITAEELRRGEIRHAIGIALVDTEKFAVFSWPATRSDGYNPGDTPNRIPEGLRFRLDPTVDVDALKMHPVGKTIARAAQKYGFVVWDKSGGITIRAQNPMSDTIGGRPNPYPALFSGTPSYAILEGFPWDRLQFLPVDYGKPR
jgi:hypothetical protein